VRGAAGTGEPSGAGRRGAPTARRNAAVRGIDGLARFRRRGRRRAAVSFSAGGGVVGLGPRATAGETRRPGVGHAALVSSHAAPILRQTSALRGTSAVARFGDERSAASSPRRAGVVVARAVPGAACEDRRLLGSERPAPSVDHVEHPRSTARPSPRRGRSARSCTPAPLDDPRRGDARRPSRGRTEDPRKRLVGGHRLGGGVRPRTPRRAAPLLRREPPVKETRCRASATRARSARRASRWTSRQRSRGPLRKLVDGRAARGGAGVVPTSPRRRLRRGAPRATRPRTAAKTAHAEDVPAAMRFDRHVELLLVRVGALGEPGCGCPRRGSGPASTAASASISTIRARDAGLAA